MKGMTSDRATSTGGSPSRRRISLATRPTASPITIPPAAATRKPVTALVRTKAPVTVATTAARDRGVRDRRDDHGREDHEADRQPRKGSEIRAEIPDRRFDRCREQQR